MEKEEKTIHPFSSKGVEKIRLFRPGSKAEAEWEKRKYQFDENGKPFSGRVDAQDRFLYFIRGECWGEYIVRQNEFPTLGLAPLSVTYSDQLKYLCFCIDDFGYDIHRYSFYFQENKIGNLHSLFIKREDLDLDKLIVENPQYIAKIEQCIEESSIWNDEITTIGYFYSDPEEKAKAQRVVWAKLRKEQIVDGYIIPENDFLPHYILQQELREKATTIDHLLPELRYVAGVDVAFHDLELRMVAAIVVLDAVTLEVVDRALHESDITFPYIPCLHSYREAPVVMEAWEKLSIKPDLLVCNGHGLDHPMGIGLATHLGVALDVPSIGCARLRLVGEYDPAKLGMEKGSTLPLLYEEQVGAAVRTKDGARPLMVSMGHRVSVETAVDWVLRLCRDSRLPESTRQAERLVRSVLPERTEIDFWAGAEPMSAVDPGPDWPDINKVLITREGGEE